MTTNTTLRAALEALIASQPRSPQPAAWATHNAAIASLTAALSLTQHDSEATQAPAAPLADVRDLSMLVRRLVIALRQADPGNELTGKATDYLRRIGMQGNLMREPTEPPNSIADPYRRPGRIDWVADATPLETALVLDHNHKVIGHRLVKPLIPPRAFEGVDIDKAHDRDKPTMVRCPDCRMEGSYIKAKTCNKCNGSGWIRNG